MKILVFQKLALSIGNYQISTSVPIKIHISKTIRHRKTMELQPSITQLNYWNRTNDHRDISKRPKVSQNFRIFWKIILAIFWKISQNRNIRCKHTWKIANFTLFSKNYILLSYDKSSSILAKNGSKIEKAKF